MVQEKKLFFNDATQKSATMVWYGIAIKSVPSWPIFEKCSHLREKGGRDRNFEYSELVVPYYMLNLVQHARGQFTFSLFSAICTGTKFSSSAGAI